MNKHVENSVGFIVTGATISAVAYFIIVVWWAGLVDKYRMEEELKHETCYIQWSFNEAHKLNYKRIEYCGD
jgi:homoserine trans-succinylase